MKKINGIWKIDVAHKTCWVTPDGMAHYDLASAEKRMKQLERKNVS